jgi:hypothetical protein
VILSLAALSATEDAKALVALCLADISLPDRNRKPLVRTGLPTDYTVAVYGRGRTAWAYSSAALWHSVLLRSAVRLWAQSAKQRPIG